MRGKFHIWRVTVKSIKTRWNWKEAFHEWCIDGIIPPTPGIWVYMKHFEGVTILGKIAGLKFGKIGVVIEFSLKGAFACNWPLSGRVFDPKINVWPNSSVEIGTCKSWSIQLKKQSRENTFIFSWTILVISCLPPFQAPPINIPVHISCTCPPFPYWKWASELDWPWKLIYF